MTYVHEITDFGTLDKVQLRVTVLLEANAIESLVTVAELIERSTCYSGSTGSNLYSDRHSVRTLRKSFTHGCSAQLILCRMVLHVCTSEV